MKDSEKLLKSMTLGDVLDYSIEAYKRNFKSIVMVLLILYLPLAFISALVSGLSQSVQIPQTIERYINLINHNYSYLNSNLTQSTMVFAILSMLFSFVGILHLLLIRPVIDASIIRIVYDDIVIQRKQPVKTILRQSFKKYGPLLGNWVLYLLIMFGIIIGICIASLLVYFAIFLIIFLLALSGPVGLITGIIIISLIVIAAILAIITFYSYFKVRFFGVFSVIIENKSATGAISRSLELTKKSFWHISLIIAFTGLFLNGFTIIATYSSFAGLFVNRTFFIIIYIAIQMLGAILSTFATCVVTMIFINMKIRKEGLDLEVKVDQLLERQKNREMGAALDE